MDKSIAYIRFSLVFILIHFLSFSLKNSLPLALAYGPIIFAIKFGIPLRRFIYHLLIPILFFSYFSLNYYDVVDWAPAGVYLQATSNILTCISILGYYFAIYVYKKDRQAEVSVAKKELLYLLKVLYMVAFVLVVVLLLERLEVIDKLTFNLRTFISLLIGGTFFIMLYYYFSIRKEVSLAFEKEQLDKGDLLMQAYEKQVHNFLESSQLFLDADISLEQLAEKTNIQSHNLTQLFNAHMGKTFYQVLSAHRIKYAEGRLKSDCNSRSITC